MIQAIVVVPIAYVGGRRNRPAWLAVFGGILVVFCLVFGALILTEYENYPVTTTYSLKQGECCYCLSVSTVIKDVIQILDTP